MPDTEQPEPLRIPISHSVRYAVRGLPDVPNQYGRGTLTPSEITLTYRATEDSQLGRVHAYVAGRLWVDGAEIPLLPGGLYGQHYDDGLDGWPEWLAEEVRLHAPDTASPSAPADRAAWWREAAVECDKAGGAYGGRGADAAAGAAFALMETFLRKADEAEYVATPCDPMALCEDDGEPCSAHERLMAYAEGDHELCAPDCGTSAVEAAAPSRVADEAQQGTPWLSDSARIGRTLIWTWSEIGKGSYGQGYRAAQSEARALLTGKRDNGEVQQTESEERSGCAHKGPHPGFTCAEVDQTRPFWEGRWGELNEEPAAASQPTKEA